VIGGVAMIARVRVRPTMDVDVVLSIEPSELPQLLAAAKDAGFEHEDDPQSRAIMEAGLVRLTLGPREAARGGVDLIFSDSPFLERVIARATIVDLGAVKLPVATVEDLLLLKLEANRPVDLDDALAIKDAHEGTMDRAYLDARAAELGLGRALESLLAE
jgi:hypothetical protein